MSIELSVEFDNLYGINAWYNLTDVIAVYICESDSSRLCVRLDYGRDYYTDIMINEANYAEPRQKYNALTDICKSVIGCFEYYSTDERHRIISNDEVGKFVPMPQ